MRDMSDKFHFNSDNLWGVFYIIRIGFLVQVLSQSALPVVPALWSVPSAPPLSPL